MRLLNKNEIIINQLIYIKGSDDKLYPLTIVDDCDYKNEDTQLSLTESYYYQEKNELFIMSSEIIKIIKYIPEKVELFTPTGLSLGILDNEHELNKVQIQIARHQLTGYYIVWKDHKITINSQGALSDWPFGMYDQTQRDFAELFKIRKENIKY